VEFHQKWRPAATIHEHGAVFSKIGLRALDHKHGAKWIHAIDLLFCHFPPPFFEHFGGTADREISPKMASRGSRSRARRRFFENRTPRAGSQTRREVDSRHRLTFLSFSAAVF
jgi:hypothetical protein